MDRRIRCCYPRSAPLSNDINADVHAVLTDQNSRTVDKASGVVGRPVTKRAPIRLASLCSLSTTNYHRFRLPNGWRLSGERQRVRCSRGLGRLANPRFTALLESDAGRFERLEKRQLHRAWPIPSRF